MHSPIYKTININKLPILGCLKLLMTSTSLIKSAVFFLCNFAYVPYYFIATSWPNQTPSKTYPYPLNYKNLLLLQLSYLFLIHFNRLRNYVQFLLFLELLIKIILLIKFFTIKRY